MTKPTTTLKLFPFTNWDNLHIKYYFYLLFIKKVLKPSLGAFSQSYGEVTLNLTFIQPLSPGQRILMMIISTLHTAYTNYAHSF